MKEDQSPNSRRNFLSSAAKAAAVIAVTPSAANSFLAAYGVSKPAGGTGFDQQPLPYAYDALEDTIDARTMEIHYTKHAASYSKALKEAAAAEHIDPSKPVEYLLKNVSHYSMKLRNNAGGHYNHEMFWQSMQPADKNNKPAGHLAAAIDKSYGSFSNCKAQFGDAAKSRFGSGWAWLYIDSAKSLKIGSTPNQDNPLMDVSDIKGMPLLGLDVWEHAYYLKYQNMRADYIQNWWSVVNWKVVEERYNMAK